MFVSRKESDVVYSLSYLSKGESKENHGTALRRRSDLSWGVDSVVVLAER